MYYSEELIEEIRSKNDIVDVISGYVRLQKKGGNYFGLCPFHNEKSPSFSVSSAKQIYYCFGCGAGGNVMGFLMKYENLTFPEAVKSLAERAGVALPEPDQTEADKAKNSKRARLLEINKEAAKYFYYQLRSPAGKEGYDYFKERGLSEETMKQFGLGYAPVSSGGLCGYLRSKGYSEELILEAELGRFDERYGLRDQFWNRVMFPIQDMNHRVIGFGGRVMGDAKPKYLNSKENMIFDKGRNLYGLCFARTARTGNIILCEGYMDVIAMHQAGFSQAVASLGTAFTSGQASLLKRYAKTVLLAYDSDGAGVNAALRAIRILKEVDLPGKIISMEPYKDPDEFIKNLGKEAFQERIDQAENSFFFEIRIMQRDYDMQDPGSRTEFHREIAKKLCEFEEAVERENYLQAIADKYMIDTENLRKLVAAYAASLGNVRPIERPRSGILSKASPEDSGKRDQRLLLNWIAEEPAIYKALKQYVGPEDFTDPLYRKVAEALFADLERGHFSPAAIISAFTEEEEQRQVAELFNTSLVGLETDKDKEKALHDILCRVKEYSFSHADTEGISVEQMIQNKKTLETLRKAKLSLYGN